MNCEQARALLVEGGAAAAIDESLTDHLAACPACARVRRELDQVRRALDAVPGPPVRVDLGALYRRAGELERLRYRNWRRLAWAASAAAAIFLVALCLRFEVRWHQRQLVIGWGLPAQPLPAQPIEPPAPAPPIQTDSAQQEQLAADLMLMKDLIHALAADVQYRADEQRSAVADLERRLDGMSATANARWTSTQQDVRALYTACFGVRDQGVTP
ncbi:MAG: hypothetical protein L0Y71_06485 [Gemmataceae bacterium]|nr:hypothetical protein [Gemmataceae bacterium]